MCKWLIAACLVACDLPPPNGPSGGSGSDDPACAQGDTWSEAESAAGTFLLMEIDSVPISVTFDENADYGSVGAPACFDTESAALSWVVEAAGEPFARITSEVFGTGNLDMTDDQSGVLLIDLFGIPEPYLVRNTDFVSGTWVVNSNDSTIEWEIVGSSVTSGRSAQWNFALEMTP